MCASRCQLLSWQLQLEHLLFWVPLGMVLHSILALEVCVLLSSLVRLNLYMHAVDVAGTVGTVLIREVVLFQRYVV